MEIQTTLGIGCLILAGLYGLRGLGALFTRRIMAAAWLVRPMRSGQLQGTRAQALGVLLIIAALVIALAGYLLLNRQSAVIALILCLSSLFFAMLFESTAVVDPGTSASG